MEINKTAKYEGYIWYSDKQQPSVIHGEEFDLDSLTSGINPFVIEGQLWSESEKVSVSIRYADGKHIITQHKVKEEDLLSDDIEQYISHIKGVGRLNFIRYWKTERDEYCENFETLRPDRLVFVGFGKNEER